MVLRNFKTYFAEELALQAHFAVVIYFCQRTEGIALMFYGAPVYALRIIA